MRDGVDQGQIPAPNLVPPLVGCGAQRGHAKFGINSSIGTGTVVGTRTVVGTGAMVASSGLTPKTVRRFAWLTDGGEQRFRWERFRWERFLETARAVMARRQETPTDACLDPLRELHGAATGN